MRILGTGHSRGQTLVEMALVLPLFLVVLVGIIVLGVGVFYQQEVTNAAREAARYAATHSATSQCPTVSWKNPVIDPTSGTRGYYRCDAPESLAPNGSPSPWPNMTTAARQKIFGLPAGALQVVACWSGYTDDAVAGSYDAPPPGTVNGNSSTWAQCLIDGHDPTQDAKQIGCAADLYSKTTDKASDLSEGQGRIVANQVTAYACYVWRPPMAGFLLIPDTVILRGVITEPIQRQQ
jgi:TadE-like protein